MLQQERTSKLLKPQNDKEDEAFSALASFSTGQTLVTL